MSGTEIEIARRLRELMDIKAEPGACPDCNGSRVVPDAEETETEGQGVWKDCPTCRTAPEAATS